MRLAGDGAAGIEHAPRHGGVDLRHETLQRRGAVHHRYTGQCDVVLQHHLAASERPARGAPDVGLDIPGVEFVLVSRRPASRCAGVYHLGKEVGQLIDAVVGGKAAFHLLQVLRQLRFGQMHVKVGGK
jgi:hypothetical protein